MSSLAAGSGPGGANEGSRWEGSPAGRDAPTGHATEDALRPGGARAEGSARSPEVSLRSTSGYLLPSLRDGGMAATPAFIPLKPAMNRKRGLVEFSPPSKKSGSEARSLKNRPFSTSWLFLHCGIAIPQRGMTIPRHGMAVPRHGTTVLWHGMAILRRWTTVPGHGRAILRSRKAIPRHGTAILWRRMTIRRRRWMAHP